MLGFDHVVEAPRHLPPGLVEAQRPQPVPGGGAPGRLEARGGTEVLGPLRQAIALLDRQPARDRVLVLVTDGQVGNEDQILHDLAGALAGIRLHAIGIDQAVNAGFLAGWPRRGRAVRAGRVRGPAGRGDGARSTAGSAHHC